MKKEIDKKVKKIVFSKGLLAFATKSKSKIKNKL